MPKVTINGKELDAPEGINLIQAADMLGMEIPHYCYHPALTVVGTLFRGPNWAWVWPWK